MLRSRLALVSFVGVAFVAAALAQSLDFATYRSRVEPVFYKKRPGHARCVSCHSAANNSFRLQAIPDGATAYTEEQSRKNFEVVSKLVIPGNPDKSILLFHPLAQEGGGDEFHSGGRQFLDKNDPDWKAIADWISQAKSK
jgi:hypothetical protein